MGVDEAEEEPDFVGRCFGYFEPTGDLRELFASESDGLNGALNRSKGDSDPVLSKWKELAVSISDGSISCI